MAYLESGVSVDSLEKLLNNTPWQYILEITNREFFIESKDMELCEKHPELTGYVFHEISKRYSVDRTLNFKDKKIRITKLIIESKGKDNFKSACEYFSEQVCIKKLNPEKDNRKNKGARANSAATKFMQFFFKEESCIYDNLARNSLRDLHSHGLKNKINELSFFINIWSDYYNKDSVKKRIDEEISNAQIKMERHADFGSEFFRRRIFDKILIFNQSKLELTG